MICCGVMLVGGAGSSGPKPAGSCAAPSGFATAAMAEVTGADSRRNSPRTVAEAKTRLSFMWRTPWRGICCCDSPHATKNRRDLGRFGDVAWSERDERVDWAALAGVVAGRGRPVGALVPGAGGGGGR